MKTKIIILFLILLSFTLIWLPKIEARGIIIADDQQILEIFRDSTAEEIRNLARKLKNYDQVILHLGARKVFNRGHPFFYRTSKKNLVIFAEQLRQQKQKFYLWFLDSFGSEMFLDIYNQHQQIIDSNYLQLQELDLAYNGIVIDLEWINLEAAANNQSKYLEMLSYLKNKFRDKKLYAFMSIVNEKKENIRRGYSEVEILNYLDNLIVMLYLKDSGYYLADDQLKLTLRDRRIDELKEYYQTYNYQIAISLTGGIFLEKAKKLYFVKTTNNFSYKLASDLFYQTENKYSQISGYLLKEEIKLTRDDGQILELQKGDRLHFLKIKQEELVEENDLIWEYFQMQK
ncbi:MAG: hypothetical protein ACQER0_06230 [Bacillota bacterium]